MSVIVLYVLDSLRADALEPYGAPNGASPEMSELAGDGVVFEEAFAQATWTRPSGASILSSTYPSLHGVNDITDQYPANIPTIATELRRAGYTTVGITAMGNIAPAFGFNAGFDEFRTLFDRNEILEREVAVKTDNVGWDDHFNTSRVGIATGDDINKEIEDVIETYEDDLFLFVWSLDTHDPYYHRDQSIARFAEPGDDEPIWNYELEQMNDEAGRSRLRDLYRDMVRYADKKIGELVDLLKDKGRYNETLLAVTGDHGEAFGEHGTNGHHGKPYEEQIHVPLILKPSHDGPGDFGSDRRNDVIETIDLYPTFCEVAGIDPKSHFVQGQSLIDHNDKHAAFIEVLGHRRSYRCVRTAHNKYIDVTSADRRRAGLQGIIDLLLGHTLVLLKSNEAYNLQADPSETDNIIDQLDISDLKEKIKQQVRENAELASEIESGVISEIDEEVESQLESLGYIE